VSARFSRYPPTEERAARPPIDSRALLLHRLGALVAEIRDEEALRAVVDVVASLLEKERDSACSDALLANSDRCLPEDVP
jgi:hypothetical protein